VAGSNPASLASWPRSTLQAERRLRRHDHRIGRSAGAERGSARSYLDLTFLSGVVGATKIEPDRLVHKVSFALPSMADGIGKPAEAFAEVHDIDRGLTHRLKLCSQRCDRLGSSSKATAIRSSATNRPGTRSIPDGKIATRMARPRLRPDDASAVEGIWLAGAEP
jgi:hypothetical protein